MGHHSRAMRVDALLQKQRPVFSFEFFPPRTEEATVQLFDTLGRLRELEPDFVSVTYGAGGSTRLRTVELVGRMRSELDLEPVAHFTCVGSSVSELCAVLDSIEAGGIENVLALRGDPPAGSEAFEVSEGGLSHASELMQLIADRYRGLCVGGACYPEGHLESLDRDADLAHTVLKVQAGARYLITQLFFDNRTYFDYVARARAAGIDVPIIAGIMPITGYEQVTRFTARIGATIPAALRQQLDARRDDPEAVTDLGVAWATLQCAELLRRGAPGIHFYTLNRSPATRAILSALRAARPWDEA
jgi:methylenetetrahydrofolate reductase (NADPH)